MDYLEKGHVECVITFTKHFHCLPVLHGKWHTLCSWGHLGKVDQLQSGVQEEHGPSSWRKTARRTCPVSPDTAEVVWNTCHNSFWPNAVVDTGAVVEEGVVVDKRLNVGVLVESRWRCGNRDGVVVDRCSVVCHGLAMVLILSKGYWWMHYMTIIKGSWWCLSTSDPKEDSASVKSLQELTWWNPIYHNTKGSFTALSVSPYDLNKELQQGWNQEAIWTDTIWYYTQCKRKAGHYECVKMWSPYIKPIHIVFALKHSEDLLLLKQLPQEYSNGLKPESFISRQATVHSRYLFCSEPGIALGKKRGNF